LLTGGEKKEEKKFVATGKFLACLGGEEEVGLVETSIFM